jgi:glutamine synthetase
MLLPAAVRWVALCKEAGVKTLEDEALGLVDEFVEAILALEAANRDYPQEEADVLDGARYVQEKVLPAMAGAREVADRLERIVPDDLWPLPKYSEILFIK